MEEQIQNTQIISKSKKMTPIFETIRKVSDSDITVLITGESGTGKELVAKAIHFSSPRAQRPFIALNCAAIPEPLLESELFGHEKGSFTGASELKIGKFELAQGGTLFLDEIGDMNLATQAKILRVLQEKEFQRVGGRKTLSSNARILAATNKNLIVEVQNKTFRQDLYFRLNVIPIPLPPLRERVEDIPLLTDHFLRIANVRFDKQIKGFSEEVLQLFKRYSWPGNIRQLENVIFRANILAADKMICVEDLPPEILDGSSQCNLSEDRSSTPAVTASAAVEDLPMQSKTKQVTENMERQIILAALEQCKWKRGITADKLGISRRSLLRKMKKYQIQ